MSDALKQLLEKVKNDKVLQDKFKACKSADDMVMLASGLGFKVTADEFAKMNKLSDDQLDQVAGAGTCYFHLG